MANITELRSPEAALKAALPEHATVPDSVGANAIRKARMEKRLRDGGASGVLESLAGHANRSDSDRILAANIGVELKPDGTKDLNAQEQARLNRGKQVEKLNIAVGEGRYDGLSNGEKAIVRNRVEFIMRRIPQLDTILTGLGAGKAAYLEKIVKDPAYASVLRQLHNDKLEGASVEENDVLSKRINWKEKDANVKTQETALNRADEQLAILARNLTESQGVDLTTAPDKATRLSFALTQANKIRTTNAAEAQKVDQHIDFRSKLAELEVQRDRATGPARVSLQNRINVLKASTPPDVQSAGGYNPVQMDYLRFRDTVERNNLVTKNEQLRQDRAEAQNALDAAKTERGKADTERAISEHKRTVEETKLVDGLDNVITESMVKYLQEQTQASEDIRKAEIEKLQEVNVDTQKAEVLQLLSTRWNERIERTGLTRRTVDRVSRKNVNKDYKELLDNGPRQLMEALIPAGITGDERNKLLNDTEMQNQFVGTLLQKRMETSRFSATEVRRIVGTTWGEAAIRKGLDQNKAAQAVITDLEGRGMMKGGLMEWLSKKDDKTLFGILTALLTGATLGAVGALAGASVLSAAGGMVIEPMVAGAAGGIGGGAIGGGIGNRMAA